MRALTTKKDKRGTQRAMTEEELPSIADLIRRHQDRTGDSLGDIAKATGLSKSAVGAITTETGRRVLRDDTITKLAKGLNLPESIVRNAALVSAGMTPTERPRDARVELIARDLENLSADDLSRVETIVSALVSRRG